VLFFFLRSRLLAVLKFKTTAANLTYSFETKQYPAVRNKRPGSPFVFGRFFFIYVTRRFAVVFSTTVLIVHCVRNYNGEKPNKLFDSSTSVALVHYGPISILENERLRLRDGGHGPPSVANFPGE